MAVTVTDIIAGPFYPNGVATTFGFDFRSVNADEIVVYRGVSPNWTALDPSLYSVSVSPTVEGGTISFAIPPATGTGPLFIQANPSFKQETSFATGEAPFTPKSLNEPLDRAAMRDLVLKQGLDDTRNFLAADRATILAAVSAVAISAAAAFGYAAAAENFYNLATTVALGDLGDVAMERQFARQSGVTRTSTADQSLSLQSAIEAASAYALANQVLVELVVPKHQGGGIRALNIVHRPGVVINGNGGKLKTINNAAYGDHRKVFQQDYNNNSWVAIPDWMRDWPVHFGLINVTIDGAAGLSSPWTAAISRYDMTAGGSYTALPTGVAFSGSAAATGMTATIVGGLNDDWTISAGGTGFVSGDVGQFIKLAVGTGGAAFNGTLPVLRIDTVVGGAVTAGTLIGRGGYTTLPSGALAQTAVVDADNIAIGAGTGFQLTPVTWRVVHVQPGTRPSELYFTETVEGGGAFAATFTGGAGTGATLKVMCGQDYYRNGSGTATEHNAGFWWRNPQGLDYVPKLRFERVRLQNCAGDGLYFGSFCEVTAIDCSSHNCFRGGYTVVCGGKHIIRDFKGTGFGLGFDVELSGGWMASSTTLRTGGGYVAIVAAGTGYKVGETLTAPNLPGAVTHTPASFIVQQVNGSGGITLLLPVTGGRYSSTAGSLAGLTLRGGSGSGATVTLQAGLDTLDLSMSGCDFDTTRGNNFLFINGEYRIQNCAFRGDRNYFLGAGYCKVQWIGNTTLCRGDGANFSTLMPAQFLSTVSTWAHRPRTTAVIPNSSNVPNDQSSVINFFNDSAGAGMPNARVDLIGDTIDGRACYPLSNYLGVNMGAAFYQGAGYSRQVTLTDVMFAGDYFSSRAVNDRAGLLTVNGGDLGPARGGGIRSSGDHTAVAGAVGYGAALHVPRLPRRGNARPFFSLPQPNGAAQDARFFNRIVGVMADNDNFWGSVNDGTKVAAEFGDLVVQGDADPTAGGVPGIIGMRYRKRRPATQADFRGYGVTVGSATNATFIAA